MTMPRPVLPDTTALVTRRCTQRQFLLRPSAVINQIVLYCLAVAAEKFGVMLHAVCVMSNHYHLALTDVHGHLPDFEHWVNEFVAKAANITLKRKESLWNPNPYDAGPLETLDGALSAMTYTITNPVAACLVTRSDLWPGLCTKPSDIGKSMKVKRPNVLFSKSGRMPEEAQVTFVPPPAYSHLPLEEFVALLRESVETREAALRAEAKANGRSFLGRRAVLRQNPFDTPNKPEKCRPRFRSKRQIEVLRAFWRAYRAAYEQFKAGLRDVLFPPGTFWMRRHAGVHCAPG